MIKIRIGAGWKSDPEVRLALRRAVGAAAREEVVRQLVDAVALEVDGVDLAAGQTEGPLFPAVEQLIDAVARLNAGERQASVHFQDGAVELVLRRRGASALVSVVKTTRPARMLAQEVEVELAALAQATQDAAAALCHDLSALQPGGVGPQAHVQKLLRAAARLKARPRAAPARPTRAEPRRPTRGVGSEAPACSFEIHDEEGVLQGFEEGGGPALGALLAPGRVTLRSAEGEAVFDVEGIPFLLVRDLAGEARRLAAAVRAGEDRFDLALALQGRTKVLPISVDLVRGTAAVGSRPPVTIGPPLLLAQAFLEAAVDFCGAVVARNPRQGGNAYLSELLASSGEQLAHLRELLAGDLLNVAPAEPLPRRRARALPRAPLGPGRMRHIAFQRTWQADVGPLSGVGLVRTGELVVATGASAVAGFDALRGQARWLTDGASWSAVAGNALLLLRDERLVCLDLATGNTRWRTPVPAQTRAPSGLCLLASGALVLSGRDALAALVPETGRLLWSFEPPATSGLAAAAMGAILVVSADNGLVYGLDTAGQTVWRLRSPGHPAGAPSGWRDGGLALFATDRGGSALAFDPATGSRTWEAPLEFTPLGPPATFGIRAAVAGLVAGDPVIAALEPRGRIAWTSAPSLGTGPLALTPFGQGLLVKGSDGSCAAFDRSGAPRWTHSRPSAHPPPGILPASAVRSVVVVPSEQVLVLDAATGALLGNIPVTAPSRLLVDGELRVQAAAADGLVTAARLRTHLSVV